MLALRLRLTLAAILSLALYSSGAGAAVIYNNGGPLAPPDLGGMVVNNLQTGLDDFSLVRPTTLTDAHFWTFEVDPASWSGSINYGVFDDTGAGNGPGALIDFGFGTNIVKLPTGNTPYGLSEFSYSFDFATPIDLLPGNYWIGFYLGDNDVDDAPIFWSTSATTAGGTPGIQGSPAVFSLDFVTFTTFTDQNGENVDAAFFLTGMPTPSTVPALGLGLMLMWVARRRRMS